MRKLEQNTIEKDKQKIDRLSLRARYVYNII